MTLFMTWFDILLRNDRKSQRQFFFNFTFPQAEQHYITRHLIWCSNNRFFAPLFYLLERSLLVLFKAKAVYERVFPPGMAKYTHNLTTRPFLFLYLDIFYSREDLYSQRTCGSLLAKASGRQCTQRSQI